MTTTMQTVYGNGTAFPPGINSIRNREGRDHRTHHLHVYEQSHPQVSDHLLFRDYLARYPEQALQYGELKRQLTNDYQYDPFGYQQAKADHCRDIVRRAHQWHDQNDE
ncbi:GrpB family protein [Paenibacillus sp. Z6-24]